MIMGTLESVGLTFIVIAQLNIIFPVARSSPQKHQIHHFPYRYLSDVEAMLEFNDGTTGGRGTLLLVMVKVPKTSVMSEAC